MNYNFNCIYLCDLCLRVFLPPLEREERGERDLGRRLFLIVVLSGELERELLREERDLEREEEGDLERTGTKYFESSLPSTLYILSFSPTS